MSVEKKKLHWFNSLWKSFLLIMCYFYRFHNVHWQSSDDQTNYFFLLVYPICEMPLTEEHRRQLHLLSIKLINTYTQSIFCLINISLLMLIFIFSKNKIISINNNKNIPSHTYIPFVSSENFHFQKKRKKMILSRKENIE